MDSSHSQPPVPASAAAANADAVNAPLATDAHPAAPITSPAAAAHPSMAPADDASRAATSPTSQTLEAGKDIVYGSLSGMAGKVIEYPFDTIKVRLQSQPAAAGVPLVYSGPLDCFRQSLRDGGVRGLYRGISAPMVGAAMEVSSLFCSYRLAQKLLVKSVYGDKDDGDGDGSGREGGERVLSLSELCLCGSMSGAATSLLLTPIELIKCKMQVPHVASSSATTSASQPGVLAIMLSIFRQDGFRGFWRGQMGTLIRETGGSAAWFGSYESVSAIFRKQQQATSPEKNSYSSMDIEQLTSSSSSSSSPATTAAAKPTLSIYQQLIAGASAGVSYNFCFYPADTIKSRIQTQEISSSASATAASKPENGRRGLFLQVGKTLYKERGLAGFYQGCGITCLRSAPSSAFIFTIYEGLRSYLG